MNEIKKILTTFGEIGVKALQQDVSKITATGKTKDSIKFDVKESGTTTILTISARDFFTLIEPGRGPRRQSKKGNFEDNMLEWMKARGIGSDLSEKKRKQLARFFTWKINREGDETFKKGGRVVYSPTLTKLVTEMTEAVIKESVKWYFKEINGQRNNQA